ncbi:13207_t:CDS:2 [Ambispora gerdemannii]|uniref:13207_t:CDS:1 n=1 Tax=Ambispora gerdemannii TaxID=144530 RepID=A0A9N9FGB1_9GLOM|nr:13207_t:CDS:2 [Ambispora gerdemannii]
MSEYLLIEGSREPLTADIEEPKHEALATERNAETLTYFSPAVDEKIDADKVNARFDQEVLESGYVDDDD